MYRSESQTESGDARSIVDGVLRRERAAAEALHDRLQTRVNGIVWRMLGADADHDDLVHQVFVTALEKMGTLRDPAALDSWIVGLTLNSVRVELRRRRRRRLFGLLRGDEVDDAAASDPERGGLSQRFYAAVVQLAPNDRVVFSLRFLEGHSLAEVAETTGCSLATAKRRLERSKAAFRRRAERDPVLASWLMETDDEQR